MRLLDLTLRSEILSPVNLKTKSQKIKNEKNNNNTCHNGTTCQTYK